MNNRLHHRADAPSVHFNGSDHSNGSVRSVQPGRSRAASLPIDRLERLYGWGMSASAACYVYRPTTIDEIRDVFAIARRTRRSVGLRGAGRSYGDASLNAENIMLDLTRMNRVLEWNPASGIVEVEPGVTIQQLWQHILPDGWWPPVVPGTMFPTIAGCAAMNIHGKNNFAVGPIGDHILDFDLLTPVGELLTCSRDHHTELFYAAIGGFGMLGCFTRIRLQMKRVYSGLLDVEAVNARSLSEMFRIFEERLDRSDYLVGWIDGFASGRSLGRGVVHQANYPAAGVDPNPSATLDPQSQGLPDRIMGLLPKSIVWRLMRPFVNNRGMRLVNTAKYRASRLFDRGGTYRQSLAAFSFLLDYIPDWKKSYGRGGLIQYQSFVPKESAEAVFRAQLELCRRHGFPSYLAVFKRHRPDDFLMTHSLDGYSLALDFRITGENRAKIWRLAREMNRLVLNASGKFYFAKDSTLTPEEARQFLGDRPLAAFAILKWKFDPEGILETNLALRLFGSNGRAFLDA